MIIGPLAVPHFPERIMNLIIDPEFESLCGRMSQYLRPILAACWPTATRALASAGMVDCRAAFHMERLA